MQIGIRHGTLRVGASGSTNRRTFAPLGDDVNLAAWHEGTQWSLEESVQRALNDE